MHGNLAILSDIHGNAHALHAVLADMDAQGLRDRVCLGDVVGYGARPAECIELLLKHQIPCLQGNHDCMVAFNRGLEGVSLPTRMSIDWTQRTLSKDHIAWLSHLPFTLDGTDWEAVHATLHHPQEWDYILTPELAAAHFPHQIRPVCFIGHTHRPLMWREGVERPLAGTGREAIPSDRRCVVNVGSVGQPRDRDPRACYAVYHRATQEISWHRVEYDIAGAQKAIVEAGLPTPFAQRLELGK